MKTQKTKGEVKGVKADAQAILFSLYNDAIVPLFDISTGKLTHYLFKKLVLTSRASIEVELRDGRKFAITCNEI